MTTTADSIDLTPKQVAAIKRQLQVANARLIATEREQRELRDDRSAVGKAQKSNVRLKPRDLGKPLRCGVLAYSQAAQDARRPRQERQAQLVAKGLNVVFRT